MSPGRLVGLLEERAGEEGLFRVSGSGRAVARLARRLDEGGAEGLERAATADLASLLKRLLVEAPPLLHQVPSPLLSRLSLLSSLLLPL